MSLRWKTEGVDEYQCHRCNEHHPTDAFQWSNRPKGIYLNECLKYQRESSKKWRIKNPGKNKQACKEWHKSNGHSVMRKLALEMLGAMCACCGEIESFFLSIDHVNEDGAAHRKMFSPKHKFSSTRKYYLDIMDKVANGSEDFQCLCMNCNWGKMMNDGVCPHKKDGVSWP